MSRLAQAEAARDAALRALAEVIRRAKLHTTDAPGDVVDLLIAAGFPCETEEDEELLDLIAEKAA